MDILDTPIPPINIFLRSSLYTTNNSSGNKNDLVFELNEAIQCDPLIDMLVSCNSFQFTNSFYTVNEYNCYFYYQRPDLIKNTVFIPLGNYNIDSLIAKLNSLVTGIFNFSYNPVTSKITISSIGGTSFKLIDIDGRYNNIYENLGFDDWGTTSFNTSFTSPYLYNLITTQVLHVCVNNLELENVFLRNSPRHNILASIHITSIFGDTQTYFNTTNYKYKINDPTITFLNIVVLDQDFNIVNFQNIDWFINIAFHYTTKKDLKLSGTLEDHQQVDDPNNYIIEGEIEQVLDDLNIEN